MKTKILFLCTGNSCRSQMAEGFVRHLKSHAVEAHSAGTAPKGVDSLAIAVMKERGVDISQQKSQHLDEFRDVDFDYTVTLCDSARESCPYVPGKTIHRGFADPPQLAATAATEREKLIYYRAVRDAIEEFVAGLPKNLEK